MQLTDFNFFHCLSNTIHRFGFLDHCVSNKSSKGALTDRKHSAAYFQVGDRVVALPDHKAWAELVAVPATSVFALPPGMSYLDAAAITMNYTVAYILLFELANLAPGKSLLLHSAGGGVVSSSRKPCNKFTSCSGE